MPHELPGDTLDDLKERDIDNLENLMKGRKRLFFKSMVEVTRFNSAMVFGTLEKLGVVMNPSLDGDQVDAMLKANNVKIEMRDQYTGDDTWRAGTYIYKNNEIVTFLGGARLNKIALKWELWVASRIADIVALG